MKSSAIQIRKMFGTLSRVESDPVGIKRLKAPSGSAVESGSAVLGIPEQRVPCIGHLCADLMGAPGQQFDLQQREAVGLGCDAVFGHCGPCAGTGLIKDGHQLFPLVLEQKILQSCFLGDRVSKNNAEIVFFDQTFPDQLIDHPQGGSILCGDDNSTGVAVDSVAEGGRKAVFGGMTLMK